MTSYQQSDPTVPGHSPQYPENYDQPTYHQGTPDQPTPGQPTDDASMQDASMKDRAAEAVDQGREAAGQVAQSATHRAQDVTHEAAQQARDLVGEAREHLSRQAGEQHRNLATNLRSLSGELGGMVERSDQSGTATQVVAQARERVDGLAGWLESREPGDVLDEVRTFARRRPGTFLLGALAAGVVVGRLTRGAIAAHTDDGSPSESTASTSLPTATPSAAAAPELGYPQSLGAEPTAEPVGYGGTAAYPSGDYSNATGYSSGGGYSDYPNGGQR